MHSLFATRSILILAPVYCALTTCYVLSLAPVYYVLTLCHTFCLDPGSCILCVHYLLHILSQSWLPYIVQKAHIPSPSWLLYIMCSLFATCSVLIPAPVYCALTTRSRLDPGSCILSAHSLPRICKRHTFHLDPGSSILWGNWMYFL